MWRPSLAAAAVAVAFAAAHAAAPPPANAASQCGQEVLDAWSNNRLGSNFGVPCYEWALAHLPPDVEGYSSAPNDIRQQLLAAIRQRDRRTTQGVAGATHTLKQEKGNTLPWLLLAVGGLALAALLFTGVRTVRRPRAATRRAASRERTRSPRSH
jgi:hypothetical protein